MNQHFLPKQLNLSPKQSEQGSKEGAIGKKSEEYRNQLEDIVQTIKRKKKFCKKQM